VAGVVAGTGLGAHAGEQGVADDLDEPDEGHEEERGGELGDEGEAGRAHGAMLPRPRPRPLTPQCPRPRPFTPHAPAHSALAATARTTPARLRAQAMARSEATTVLSCTPTPKTWGPPSPTLMRT
jgi:hypothetical protein